MKILTWSALSLLSPWCCLSQQRQENIWTCAPVCQASCNDCSLWLLLSHPLCRHQALFDTRMLHKLAGGIQSWFALPDNLQSISWPGLCGCHVILKELHFNFYFFRWKGCLACLKHCRCVFCLGGIPVLTPPDPSDVNEAKRQQAGTASQLPSSCHSWPSVLFWNKDRHSAEGIEPD